MAMVTVTAVKRVKELGLAKGETAILEDSALIRSLARQGLITLVEHTRIGGITGANRGTV